VSILFGKVDVVENLHCASSTYDRASPRSSGQVAIHARFCRV
jgi:hypothetical protein